MADVMHFEFPVLFANIMLEIRVYIVGFPPCSFCSVTRGQGFLGPIQRLGSDYGGPLRLRVLKLQESRGFQPSGIRPWCGGEDEKDTMRRSHKTYRIMLLYNPWKQMGYRITQLSKGCTI